MAAEIPAWAPGSVLAIAGAALNWWYMHGRSTARTEERLDAMDRADAVTRADWKEAHEDLKEATRRMADMSATVAVLAEKVTTQAQITTVTLHGIIARMDGLERDGFERLQRMARLEKAVELLENPKN